MHCLYPCHNQLWFVTVRACGIMQSSNQCSNGARSQGGNTAEGSWCAPLSRSIVSGVFAGGESTLSLLINAYPADIRLL